MRRAAPAWPASDAASTSAAAAASTSPRFRACGARTVVGVEPHPPLVDARPAAAWPGSTASRCSTGPPSACRWPTRRVDVAHARWAYFFGAGCEPGLAELARVLRPGRHRLRDRQRRHALDLRRLVPPGLPRLRPAGGRAVLGSGRAGHASASTSAGTSTRATTSRRSCASSSPRPPPRGSWPSTRAPASTTPSTSGGAPSD